MPPIFLSNSNRWIVDFLDNIWLNQKPVEKYKRRNGKLTRLQITLQTNHPPRILICFVHGKNKMCAMQNYGKIHGWKWETHKLCVCGYIRNIFIFSLNSEITTIGRVIRISALNSLSSSSIRNLNFLLFGILHISSHFLLLFRFCFFFVSFLHGFCAFRQTTKNSLCKHKICETGRNQLNFIFAPFFLHPKKRIATAAAKTTRRNHLFMHEAYRTRDFVGHRYQLFIMWKSYVFQCVMASHLR